MKPITLRTPNLIDLQTGHKTFDRQATYVGTGNVIGDIQFSTYIRPYTDTVCNGFSYAAGYLRNYDLHHWDYYDLPTTIRQYILTITQQQGIILYQFRHWRNRQRYVHGYIITDTHDHFLRLFRTGRQSMSTTILETVAPYISDFTPLATTL